MVTRKVFCFEPMFIDTKILVYVFQATGHAGNKKTSEFTDEYERNEQLIRPSPCTCLAPAYHLLVVRRVKCNRTSAGNLHRGCWRPTWWHILEELYTSRPLRCSFFLSCGLVMEPAMRAETSLRFSQLSLQCLNASQNPTARRAWSPAENLHLLSKCKPITAGCRGAIVPSSFLLPLTKQKKKRGLKKTKQKHVFVFLSRNTEGRYSSAADDINKTVVLLTATILGFGNTERPQSSHCLTPRQRKLNKFLKIVILQISRRATANYPQSNS